VDLGAASAIKVADRVYVGYVRQSNPTNLTLTLNSQGDTQTDTLTMDQGDADTYQMDYGAYRLSGNRLGVELGGSAPLEVDLLQLNYLIEGTESMR
jgi:hypothetical protein